jgi:hypothetical protein
MFQRLMNHRIGGHCQSQNKILAETKTVEVPIIRAESFTKIPSSLLTFSSHLSPLTSPIHPFIISSSSISSIMTSKRLLFLLGLSTSMNFSNSYTTNSLSPLASSEPHTIATSTMRKPNPVDTKISQVLPLQQLQEQNESRRVTYSLGLGKNQPVLGASTTANTITSEETVDDVYQAVQFWTGHKAVRNIPSPNENLKLAEKLKADEQSKPPKSSARHIVPTRLAQDLLSISNHHHVGEESRGPTMIGDVQAMDLNTPWVEMLIHEQQLKFA